MNEQATARVESGAAKSYREAERQIAEETGKPIETVHKSVQRGKLGTVPPSDESQNEDDSCG
jgi:hypothetical protein